mmetsp:Transcript_2235/g.7073  ORF Transcript_2235/g.7073 Transcript_2235/m.7073 type:complete len:249 (-) Transcript_2235:731-1477(-)
MAWRRRRLCRRCGRHTSSAPTAGTSSLPFALRRTASCPCPCLASFEVRTTLMYRQSGRGRWRPTSPRCDRRACGVGRSRRSEPLTFRTMLPARLAQVRREMRQCACASCTRRRTDRWSARRSTRRRLRPPVLRLPATCQRRCRPSRTRCTTRRLLLPPPRTTTHWLNRLTSLLLRRCRSWQNDSPSKRAILRQPRRGLAGRQAELGRVRVRPCPSGQSQPPLSSSRCQSHAQSAPLSPTLAWTRKSLP